MLLLLDIKRFDDSLVIYFDSESPRINAYTLASALVSFADAVKVANSDLNPGYDVEVVVEALGSGSFKARVVALYTSTNNLFAKHVVLNVALGVVMTHFIEKRFGLISRRKLRSKPMK